MAKKKVKETYNEPLLLGHVEDTLDAEERPYVHDVLESNLKLNKLMNQLKDDRQSIETLPAPEIPESLIKNLDGMIRQHVEETGMSVDEAILVSGKSGKKAKAKKKGDSGKGSVIFSFIVKGVGIAAAVTIVGGGAWYAIDLLSGNDEAADPATVAMVEPEANTSPTDYILEGDKVPESAASGASAPGPSVATAELEERALPGKTDHDSYAVARSEVAKPNAVASAPDPIVAQPQPPSPSSPVTNVRQRSMASRLAAASGQVDARSGTSEASSGITVKEAGQELATVRSPQPLSIPSEPRLAAAQPAIPSPLADALPVDETHAAETALQAQPQAASASEALKAASTSSGSDTPVPARSSIAAATDEQPKTLALAVADAKRRLDQTELATKKDTTKFVAPARKLRIEKPLRFREPVITQAPVELWVRTYDVNTTTKSIAAWITVNSGSEFVGEDRTGDGSVANRYYTRSQDARPAVATAAAVGSPSGDNQLRRTPTSGIAASISSGDISRELGDDPSVTPAAAAFSAPASAGEDADSQRSNKAGGNPIRGTLVVTMNQLTEFMKSLKENDQNAAPELRKRPEPKDALAGLRRADRSPRPSTTWSGKDADYAAILEEQLPLAGTVPVDSTKVKLAVPIYIVPR